MRFVRKHIEIGIITLCIIIMIIANFWHVIYFWFQKPNDTTYIGITHYYEDYFYYLSTVKQGMFGNWLTENLYTTEPITAAPIWTVNLLIGKVGAIIGASPWTIYNFAVVMCAVAWLLTIYIVIRKMIPQNTALRIAAFLIALTSSPYYLLQRRSTGELFVNPYLYFYNYTSAFNRIGGVFHLILQNILSLLAIFIAGNIISALSLGTISQKEFIRKSFLLTLLLTVLMFINPSYVIVDVQAIAFVGALFFFIKPKFSTLRRYFFLVFMAGSVLGISYLVLSRAFSDPFYVYFRQTENLIQPTIPDIFFHSMGVILPLALLGAIPFVAKKQPLYILGAVYTIIPIILYFSDIPQKLGLPYFRIHQPPAYVFLGIAAAEGIWLVSTLIAKMLKRLEKVIRKNNHLLQLTKLASMFTCIFTALFIAFHLPMHHLEITDRMNSYWLPSWLNSMEQGTFEGFMTLEKLPRDKNVLAFNNLEILVPALTGHRVYVGHKSLTYDYPRKIAETYQFYNGQMSSDVGQAFLTTNNIGYILWHKQDGTEKLQTYYPYLKNTFENDSLTIYEIL